MFKIIHSIKDTKSNLIWASRRHIEWIKVYLDKSRKGYINKVKGKEIGNLGNINKGKVIRKKSLM